MANNRELGQFGRLVTVIDNTFVGVGTTSGQTITFGNIAPVNVNASGVVTATSFVGDGSGLTNISGSGGGGTSSQWTTSAAGITTTSNVGIGTTLPTANLHVVGSGTTVIIIDGGNAKIIGNLNVTGTVFATDFDAVPGGGSYQGVPGIVTSIVAGDNITVSGSTGQVTINSTASGSQWTTGASGISTTSSVLIGSATPTGTASQPLQVTGGAYVSGSVGLGTTNPVSKLDVSGGSITLSSVPFFRNIPTISADYTVTTSYNEMSIGPITVNSGVTVTVNSGATWTVV